MIPSLGSWWSQRTRSEAVVYTIACYVLIAYAGIEIGRAIYQVTH